MPADHQAGDEMLFHPHHLGVLLVEGNVKSVGAINITSSLSTQPGAPPCGDKPAATHRFHKDWGCSAQLSSARLGDTSGSRRRGAVDVRYAGREGGGRGRGGGGT